MAKRTVSFWVPGTPQGKGRPRAGKNRRGETVIYTPDKTVAYENYIKSCWYGAAHRRRAGSGPVHVNIHAFFAPPEKASAKHRQRLIENAWNDRPLRKPDADNIAKAVLDALNGVAYDDDRQVAGFAVYKYYGETAGLEIEVAWEE